MTATSNPLQRFTRIPVLLLLALFAASAPAQQPQLDDLASGRKYVIAFPDTTTNALDIRYPNNRFKDSWNLLLYSAAANNRVRITTNGGSPVTNLTLQAGRFQVHDLQTNLVVTRVNSIERNTFTVEADFPITLYCYAAARQGMEAWTPIPVEMWGTEYNAATIPGDVVENIGTPTSTAVTVSRKEAPAEILVIAAYDSTRVTITASSGQRLAGRNGGQAEVVLNAGECYQVQSIVDTTVAFNGRQRELAGSTVRANKPIGVISGNTRTRVRQDQKGITGNASKNMLVEWLAPTEQHGTEFVFLPSWDSRRPGINSPSERGAEYARIYGTSPGQTPYYRLLPGTATQRRDTVARDTVDEFEHGGAVAAYFKTEKPAQGMMHSSSIMQLVAETPCFQGVLCRTFNAWAAYMVEMTPREQWTSFAPYYAPLGPAPMQHYINVVTDTNSIGDILTETGQPFPFTRKIPGTDLIWGSQTVSVGVDHYLVARNGGRFAGHVYGFAKGDEQFRPGAPAEYEEYNALSYGYPLSPRRALLRGADSLVIDTASSCSELAVGIRAVNPNPVGLLSVALDPTSVDNAKLVPVAPATLSDVIGRTDVMVNIVAINPLSRAAAILIIKDRSGKTWRVPYSYEPDSLKVSAPAVDFSSLPVGTSRDTVITFTNERDSSVLVWTVTLNSRGAGGADAGGFTILSTEPSGPAGNPAKPVTLKKGETFTVHLRINVTTRDTLYQDTVKVTLGCGAIAIPVRATTAEPLIMVNDLHFEMPLGGESPAGELRVCNIGGGILTFENVNADSVIAWSDGNFWIGREQIDSLKMRRLGPAECYSLYVRYRPTATGSFGTVARIFANTRNQKDTSVWTVNVWELSGVDEEAVAGDHQVRINPNPAGGRTTIGYTLASGGHVTVAIHTMTGERVAVLVDEVKEAGEQSVEWDARGMAAGVYYCRLSAGDRTRTHIVVITR